MRKFVSLLSCVGGALISVAAASRPIVVELFTSEGCSSCPPAEQLIESLAKRPDVLPLAFHVDYWNSLGWIDRFSLQEATQRQEATARTLGLTTVGTPQFIIEGRTSTWGASLNALQKVLRPPSDDIPVTAAKDGQSLLIHVERAPTQASFDVYVVGYLGKAVSHIASGENAGRTLTEVNIVRYIRRIGRSTDAASQWALPLDDLPKDADHVAILLQHPRDGVIVGAFVMARP
ncbi:MAG TPA: DUF1223 domain-containing protein [Steroidobacteraceae bacterium]|jgi:hypothetical protein